MVADAAICAPEVMPFCAGPVAATVVVLARRSVRGGVRENADSVPPESYGFVGGR